MAGSEMKKRVIGLLGGTGSGKSTAASWLQDAGFPVIDADEVSRELTRQGRAGYTAVIRTFGPGILDDSGEIDRRKLASIVFSDETELRRLEEALHPLMRQDIKTLINEAAAQTVILDCAVLLRPAFRDLVDEVWMVDAPEKTRLARITKRDGITAGQAKERMDAQLPASAMRAEADRVITNDGPVQNLYGQLKEKLDAADWRTEHENEKSR